MKKLYLLLLFVSFLAFSSKVSAQYTYNYPKTPKVESKSGFDSSKLVYGGGFGLGFGSNGYWNISLSPQIGYELTPKFVAGLGMTYSHSSEKFDSWSGGRVKHTQDYVGMNLFAHYYPTSWSLISLKPEGMRVWDNYSGPILDYEEEEFVPAVVVGVGVRLKPMFITLNYDLVQSDRKPYGDNIFWSVGFLF